MDDENGEGKLFSTFDRHREFADAQSALLELDCNVEPSPEADRSETLMLKKLTDIVRAAMIPYGPLLEVSSSFQNTKNSRTFSIHSWTSWSYRLWGH